MSFDTNQNSYKALRNIVSERTQNILFWIGSGCSKPAGVPLWHELKNGLISAFESQIGTSSENEAKRIKQAVYNIKQESDNWVAFTRLKELGEATYESKIKELLTIKPETKTPPIYDYLWKLPSTSGILDLNLDDFAEKSCYAVKKEAATHFVGRRIRNHLSVLGSNKPFIAHLHGIVDDVSSWIFTHDELRSLTVDDMYTGFIQSCFSAKTVVFIGISANDTAAGGFLEKISSSGGNTGQHFWITSNRDLSVKNWGEKIGLQTIRYTAKQNDPDHKELSELFQDLSSFVSKDEEVNQPVQLSPDTLRQKDNSIDSEIYSPNDLVKEDVELIRYALNEYASEILEPQNNDAYEKYDEFCRKYDEAMYRAWYIPDDNNVSFLDKYELSGHAASGAFGNVYRASDDKGNQLAIKILLPEIRKTKGLRQSFRRGVKSMKILKKHNVNGMVEYKDASEIPACVVMDWIEGPNLTDAVKSKRLKDWSDILRVASETAKIIHSAHSLPERVLHRDIRPSNIMIENMDNSNTWKVVVLDFDLSWHKGASEKSILPQNATLGYLSPEQLSPSAKISTRHSSVDSFGLGMTYFFIISGKDPIPAEHLHTDWRKKVKKLCQTKTCKTWHSLPNRFGRLILNATKNRQNERSDMPYIEKEITRLNEAYLEPGKVKSPELIAEEIAARTTYINDYKWNEDRSKAQIEIHGNLRVNIQGDESNNLINLTITANIQTTSAKGKTLRSIENKVKETNDSLIKHGWKVNDDVNPNTLNVNIGAQIDSCLALKRINAIADCINQIITTLS